jgi:hypothetical protein
MSIDMCTQTTHSQTPHNSSTQLESTLCQTDESWLHMEPWLAHEDIGIQTEAEFSSLYDLLAQDEQAASVVELIAVEAETQTTFFDFSLSSSLFASHTESWLASLQSAVPTPNSSASISSAITSTDLLPGKPMGMHTATQVSATHEVATSPLAHISIGTSPIHWHNTTDPDHMHPQRRSCSILPLPSHKRNHMSCQTDHPAGQGEEGEEGEGPQEEEETDRHEGDARKEGGAE